MAAGEFVKLHEPLKILGWHMSGLESLTRISTQHICQSIIGENSRDGGSQATRISWDTVQAVLFVLDHFAEAAEFRDNQRATCGQSLHERNRAAAAFKPQRRQYPRSHRRKQ